MPEEIDHIAELQKRLYARDPDSVPKRKFGILRPVKQTVTSTWGQTDAPLDQGAHRTTMSGYKRFFIFSFIFFLIALSAAAFSVYRGALTLSSKNVDVNILGNSFVGGGQELSLEVEIANKNSADLIEAVLSFDYPRGALDQTGTDTVRVERPLGTIQSGKSRSEAFTAILYGEQGATRVVTAHLTYKLAGASSVFQKTETFEVTISSSPITLTVDGPAAVASSQPFTLTMRNLFSGDAILGKTIIRTEYPNGFVFQSANPAPTSGNNVWVLGDLEQGAERVITVVGKLVGEEQDQKSFRIYVGTPESDTSNKIGVTYNSGLHTVTIAKPFIAATLAIGSQSGDVAAIPIGSPVKGMVSWVNNASSTITNPVFTVTLDGAGLDPASVDAGDGYYNALDRTITWSGTTNSTIASLTPGQTGQLPFSFAAKAGSTSDITVSLSVKGTIPDQNYIEQSIANLDARIVRFAAHLQFAATSLYSVGAIKNTGPFPAKADEVTTYTLNWTMRPSEHPLSNATATALLPEGVVWTGVIMPQAEQISYNPDTRTVLWNAGGIAKSSSTTSVRTVSFQVSVRPTKTQVGSLINLLGETTISATDATANVPLTITRPALSTRLDSDPAYSPGQEKVLP